MMKKILSLFIATSLSTSVFAQLDLKHELSANVGFGISSLRYDIDQGSVSQNTGYTFGVGYYLKCTENWSIGLGLGVDYYSSTYTADVLNGYTLSKNLYNYPFDFHYTYTGYEEKVEATTLSIPLMARFEYPFGAVALQLAAGFKLGVPVSSSYSASGSLTTKAYFPEVNVWVDNKPDHGFVTDAAVNAGGELELSPSVGISVQAGVKYALNDGRSALALLGYFEMGLNNMINGNQAPVVWRDSDPLEYSSIATSTSNNQLYPMAVGAKVCYLFSLSKEYGSRSKRSYRR